MYQFKILRINDFSEWINDNPMLGAGPEVDGSKLYRRVEVEVSNGLVPLEVKDFLVPEPYSTTSLRDLILSYKATLPPRNDDEGIII